MQEVLINQGFGRSFGLEGVIEGWGGVIGKLAKFPVDEEKHSWTRVMQ